MKILKRLEATVFLHQDNISIYQIKSKQELRGLMNKYPLRILFDGNNFYCWEALKADHQQVKEILKNYINIDNFEGFLIENYHLIPSLQKRGGMIDKLLLKYFPLCSKEEKDKEGIILKF